jgi:hypothetical protein
MKVSKNGKDIYDIPDTDEEQAKAEAKGYKRYIEVTKNGSDVFTIPADDNVEKAFAKGYKTLDQYNATKNPSTATNVTNTIQDTIRGISQGVTLGYGDEILGAAGALFGDGSYQENRDAKRKEYEEARARSPIANTAGEIGGSVVTGFAAPGIGSTLKGSVAFSAGQGLGNSEADLTKGDVVGAARDTALGAGAGALGYGAGKAIEAGVKGAGTAVGSSVDYLKALGRGFKQGAKEGQEILPGTLGTVAGGAPQAVREVLGTFQEKGQIKALANEARKIRRIQDLDIQGVGNAKKLPDLSDEDAILEALMMPGDNAVKQHVNSRASSVLGGNLDNEQLTRLLSTDSAERLAARRADPRVLAEELVPEFQKAQEMFEGARTNRFNELQNIARQDFEGDTEGVVQGLKGLIEDSTQFKSVPGSVRDTIEDTIMLTQKGDNAFDALQAARKFLDDRVDWKNPSKTPGDNYLRQARKQIDEALKAAEGKIEADKMFTASKNVEGRVFDPAEFNNPATGKYEIDAGKIKRLLGNNDAAARFKSQIDALDEFSAIDGMPENFKKQAKLLSDSFKSRLKQMELKRDLGGLRQAQGPSSPAIARLEAIGGGGARVAQAVKDPQGFMNNVDQFNDQLMKKFGKNISQLEGKEKSAALKMFTWINKNSNSDAATTEKMWQQFLK